MSRAVDDYLANRAIGGWVGPGWVPLVYVADAVLEMLIPGYQINQVKEKFGTLRFYYSLFDEADESAIRQAQEFVAVVEGVSGIICEECGRRGSLDSQTGWWRTLCEEHSKGRTQAVQDYRSSNATDA